MIRMMIAAIAAAGFALCTGTASAQLADAKVLTLEAAKRITAAAQEEARKNKWTMAIAIVDAGGNLMYFEKADDTQLGSVDVAIGKAKTAFRFKRPTKVFEEVVKTRPAIAQLDSRDFTPVEGGIPIVVGGKVIGAIGVSGAASPEDAQCAEAGIKALIQ